MREGKAAGGRREGEEGGRAGRKDGEDREGEKGPGEESLEGPRDFARSSYWACDPRCPWAFLFLGARRGLNPSLSPICDSGAPWGRAVILPRVGG